MEQMNLISPEIMAEISNGNSTKLPDNTRKMMQILASLNTPKELLASLLEIAEFSLHHVRYLAGPLVIHRSPWSDTIPQWLKFACIQERLELIFTEYEQDQVGVFSTATEVLTYMMPATYEAPLHRDYADLYLWVGNEVLTKYDKLPEGCKSFENWLLLLLHLFEKIFSILTLQKQVNVKSVNHIKRGISIWRLSLG